MHLEGSIYVDGSCAPSVFRGLGRASLALVMQCANGSPIKTMQLTVPRHLPQTSQAAENLVMGVAFSAIRGTAEVIGDCLSVVRSYATSAMRALRPTQKYAGIRLAAYRDPEVYRMTTVRWTKAHKTLSGNETAEEERDVRGNAAADEAAKAALKLHPPLGADIAADVEFYTKRAPHVFRAVTAAMECFARAPLDMPRRARPTTTEEAVQAQRHLWRFRAGAWRCEVCDDFITARRMPSYRRHQRCTGRNMADDAAAHAAAGHAMIRAAADLPFTMCSRCGAWGNRRTRRLGQRCAPPPTRAGRQAIKRVLMGQHPLLQKRADGTDAPRAKATIVAAYDALAATWVPINRAEDQRGRMEAAAHKPHALVRGDDDDQRAMEITMNADVDHGDYVRPPSIADDAEYEMDIFGHGGQLDEHADTPAVDTIMRAASGDDAARGRDATPSGAAAATAASARRRQRSREKDDATRCFTTEAIERIGAALRRRDTDPQGRMERLRRRVAARSGHGGPSAEADAEPGHQGPRQVLREGHHGHDPPRQDEFHHRHDGSRDAHGCQTPRALKRHQPEVPCEVPRSQRSVRGRHGEGTPRAVVTDDSAITHEPSLATGEFELMHTSIFSHSTDEGPKGGERGRGSAQRRGLRSAPRPQRASRWTTAIAAAQPPPSR